MTDEYTAHINTHQKDANIMTKDFNAAIVKAVAETIPRGVSKKYRPYWTEELQQLEKKLMQEDKGVKKEPTTENNINLKAKTASYKKTFTEAARNSWKRETENLNLDKD